MPRKSWIDRYKELRATWVAARGAGAQGSSGTLPRMLAGDGVALIAPFTEAVLQLAQQRNQNAAKDLVVNLDTNGPFGNLPDGTTIVHYLMKGSPKEGRAAIRKVGSDWYAVPVHPDFVEAWVAVVASWQGAVNLASSVLKSGPLRPLDATEIKALWSQTYRICTALDVGGEIYEETTWERFKGAVRYAAVETGGAAKEITVQAAEVAGQITAHVAETAGEALGKGVSGFFGEAGLTAIVVTAGALYIALA